MRTGEDLSRLLERIDGRGYKAYREIRGAFDLGLLTLYVDHVQGDPFAAPSKLRLRLPMERTRLPSPLREAGVRRLALGDFLARAARRIIREICRRERSGSGKSGLVSIDAGGQEVLERSAIRIEDDWVEARIEVGLPASGRSVMGRTAKTLLCDALPQIAVGALVWENLDQQCARQFVSCIANQEHIRGQLDERGLIAFVGDDSILPRASGANDRPMPSDRARPFRSPPSLRVSMPLLDPIAGPDGPRNSISGMGIRKGVNLIVGGGYHGKSTLLRALECGVYPHVPGDGREWVVAASDLVKIRAEDGRSVARVDIESFISALPAIPGSEGDPGPSDTRAFSSQDASGSTSQAANIMEALEAGARGLLLDEDTSATNFMLRDARMQELVACDHEPITPFVDRVRELFELEGVSTVLVMGGCGDYFDVADSVIMMQQFEPFDVTRRAHEIAEQRPSQRHSEARAALHRPTPRIPLARSVAASRGRRPIDIAAKGRHVVRYGEQTIDLRGLEQLLDTSQTRAVGLAIHLASERFMRREPAHAPPDAAPAETLRDVLHALEAFLDAEGVDALDPRRRQEGSEKHPGNLARPRRFEIAATLDRLRCLEVAQTRENADTPEEAIT